MWTASVCVCLCRRVCVWAGERERERLVNFSWWPLPKKKELKRETRTGDFFSFSGCLRSVWSCLFGNGLWGREKKTRDPVRRRRSSVSFSAERNREKDGLFHWQDDRNKKRNPSLPLLLDSAFLCLPSIGKRRTTRPSILCLATKHPFSREKRRRKWKDGHPHSD